jgi:lipoprotein-anchoring transpeptidase ErfK/SrfK
LDSRSFRKFRGINRLVIFSAYGLECALFMVDSNDLFQFRGGRGMIFRTAGALAALFVGLMGASSHQALAQYYPPPQAYPPQAYPPPYGSPVADTDDVQPYDPPMAQSRPLPPAAVGPQANDPSALPPPGAQQYGRGAPIEQAELPPPGTIYSAPPPGYVPMDPGARVARPYYGQPADAAPPQAMPPQGALPQQGYEPASSSTRPYYPPGTMPPAAAVQPNDPDAMRPPMAISPGQFAPGQADPNATGAVRGMAALPPDYRPETGPTKELPPQFRRTLVDFRTKEPAGTIIIDTPNTYLYLVLGDGKAVRYGVGVGREGFTWNGAEKVTRMAEWPDWHPPEEMIERQPYLPRFMAGGNGNPLGARALYLGKTVYRIHGTNQPSTIGSFVSSGCIRLTNEDIQDLYTRVKVGTRVVVMPGGKAPVTASASPAGGTYQQGYQQGYPQQGYQQGYPQGPIPPSAMAR